MSATFSADVLQDDLALLLVRIDAITNQRACELGVDILQSIITITQSSENGPCWRLNHGPKEYIERRSGDLVIELDAVDMSINKFYVVSEAGQAMERYSCLIEAGSARVRR